VRHVAGVMNILGHDDDASTTQRTERITVRNNLFEHVDAAAYGPGAKAVLIGGEPASIVFDRNTFIHTNSTAVAAYGPPITGFVFTSNNLQHQKYGINGDGTTPGNPALAKYFPGSIVRCNVLAGGSAALYPSPNSFPSVAQWIASFVDAADGDYRVKAGSPVALGGCGGVVPGVDTAAVNAAIGIAPGALDPPPSPANAPPVADAGGPYTTTINTLMSVDGTKSVDPDGSVLDYRWHWGDEVLVRAADLPASAIHGSEWVRTSAADASGGAMLLNPDKGAAERTPLASPASYVEFTINAAVGVPYYVWMRLRAENNSYSNDSLSLQFSGATTAQGQSVARIGTADALPIILEWGRDAGVSGWGWTDSVYGGVAQPLYFAQSGPQKVRIQQRQDGVSWDQLIVSSAAFTSSPGPSKNDRTFVDEELGTGPGVSAAHRYVRAGVYPILLIVTDAQGATASDSATVTVK